jgi:hypothetical protein
MEVLKDKDWAVVNIQERGNANEIVNALKLSIELKSEYNSKDILLTFSKPSRIYSRKKYREVTKQKLSIFIGDKTGKLCYSTTGTTGYLVENSNIEFQNIISIEVVNRFSKEHEEDESSKLKSAIKRALKIRFNSDTWSNLNENDNFGCSNGSFYDIRKVFDQYDLEYIRRSFEEKKPFRVSKEGKKRDFSASAEVREDGIYRAWFSSEYSGCGNGSYYLLLNPTTAFHCEDD